MDIKDNKYKRIISGISVDENMGKIIGLQIKKYDQTDVKLSPAKKRIKHIYSSVIIAIFSILIAAVALFIAASISHPFTPKGVVKQYVYALENHDIDKAEKYIGEGYEISQDLQLVKVILYKTNFSEQKEDRSKSKSKVCLNIYYFNGQYDEYIFIANKINGKWYIVSRE